MLFLLHAPFFGIKQYLCATIVPICCKDDSLPKRELARFIKNILEPARPLDVSDQIPHFSAYTVCLDPHDYRSRLTSILIHLALKKINLVCILLLEFAYSGLFRLRL